jgi:MerR-like DNA binding protein
MLANTLYKSHNILGGERNVEYTLQEAARYLGIDSKTLKRWMELAGIEPEQDTLDRRRLLLTQAQVDEIARLYRRTSGREDRIDQIERRLTSLEEEMQVMRTAFAGLTRDRDDQSLPGRYPGADDVDAETLADVVAPALSRAR